MISEQGLKAKARELISEYGYRNPQEIDIEEMMWGERIALEEEELGTDEGMIIHRKGYGLITIQKGLTGAYRRIVISHEMGHFYSINQFKRCKSTDLYTYKPDKNNEYISNIFATELLMPEDWYTKYTRGMKPEIKTLKETAEYFNVSLSSASHRYSTYGSYPTAIILSERGKVVWSIISKEFPLQFIRTGMRLSQETEAHKYFYGHETEEAPVETRAMAWFPEDFGIKNYSRDYYLKEENFIMRKAKRVLTILSEKVREWEG